MDKDREEAEKRADEKLEHWRSTGWDQNLSVGGGSRDKSDWRPGSSQKGKWPQESPFTGAEITVLHDEASRAVKATIDAMSAPLEAAGDLCGVAGVYFITQRVLSHLAVGAGMTMFSMRTGETPGNDTAQYRDDLLLACLMAAHTHHNKPGDLKPSEIKAEAKKVLGAVLDAFEKIRGYKAPLPTWWPDLGSLH